MTQEEIIHHTKQLVSFRSIAGNQAALHQCIDYITNLLAPHTGITVEQFESNGIRSLLAYYSNTRPVRFDTILNGHVDVVPAQHESQYTPVIKDGRFYGRGVYDMKMACIAMTDVFIRCGRNPKRAFGLQIVSDEETSGRNGILYQLTQGVAADFTILGEMTDLAICNETRGICWVEVGFSGTSAHGGYAWNGVNAISKASDFATALLAKFPIPKAQQWCSTANIAAISTENTTFNIVPDQATVKVDFRFTPEDPHFTNTDTVEALVKSIHPEAHIIGIDTFDPAVQVAPDNPHLQQLVAAYQKATGKPASLIRRYASGDSRYLVARGMAGIEFGLAGAHLHGRDEYVELSSLQPFCDTLEAYMSS